VWNEEFQTMESTLFGHPGQPRAAGLLPEALPELDSANFGLTFEDDGLRARAKIARKKK